MQVKFFCLCGKQAETKIDDFDVIVLIYHDIIQFNISMGDFLHVKVLDACNNSSEYFLGGAFFFLETGFFLVLA